MVSNEKLYEIAQQIWTDRAGMVFHPPRPNYQGETLTMIVDAVAAAVRAECANICDELHWSWRWADDTSGPKECAESIRALNKQEPK